MAVINRASTSMIPPKADPVSAPHLSLVFRSCQTAFLSAALFSCVINILMLSGPIFMLQVYDRVLASRSVPTLIALAILVGILFVFLGLFDLLRARILARIARRIDQRIHAALFGAVIDHSVRRTLNLRAQPLRDLDTLRQFLAGPSPATLFDLPWTPIYIAIIFLLHVDLGIFALAGAALLAALAAVNDRLTRVPLARSGEGAMLSHRIAEECRRNAAVIQAMGMLPEAQARWQAAHDKALSDHLRASDRNGAFSALAKCLRLVLQSAILALGAYLVILQDITAGTIIASSILMSRALAPIEQGISHWRGFLNVLNAVRRLGLVLADSRQQRPKMALPAPKGRLGVEGLSIAAPGEATPILRGIGFALQPGQALGVIGPSGAGKSTLARALANVWAPASGVISMDGAPFPQWDAATLGRHIGYLPQDVDLFEGTFEENIARFQRDAKPENVIRAARLTGVHDLILQFPDGYKTHIGEAGIKLSVGQRQRIGLARALYGDPALIILDEPNASLDAAGENALSRAIAAATKRGATVIVVSHRPSVLSYIDLVLLLNGGRQIAFGPKREVLKNVVIGPAPGAYQPREALHG